MSHAIFREVGERLNLRPINEVSVKGKRSTLQIYELLGVIDNNNPNSVLQASDDLIEKGNMTKLAYAEFIKRNWKQAALLYEAVLLRFPEDALSINMIQRCHLEQGLDSQDGF